MEVIDLELSFLMDGVIPYERQFPRFKLEWLMGDEAPLGFDLTALFCSGMPEGRLLTA